MTPSKLVPMPTAPAIKLSSIATLLTIIGAAVGLGILAVKGVASMVRHYDQTASLSYTVPRLDTAIQQMRKEQQHNHAVDSMQTVILQNLTKRR